MEPRGRIARFLRSGFAALLTELIVIAPGGPQLCLCLTTFAILWKGMPPSSHHRRPAPRPPIIKERFFRLLTIEAG
ncbi:hypothetical protein [Sinorhizobium meliloti]|uniref:hypothetical protein n=1 Tax=Rhizobium meliloti TaxID=382 RepID=UPI0013E3218A|nr:hypothetical protein [Sinorhizobium meliloti]